jgi:hypothetical protein
VKEDKTIKQSVNNDIFKGKNINSWGDNSRIIGARVKNLVTYDMVGDKIHIFEI